jgi:hypothetical protein
LESMDGGRREPAAMDGAGMDVCVRRHELEAGSSGAADEHAPRIGGIGGGPELAELQAT